MRYSKEGRISTNMSKWLLLLRIFFRWYKHTSLWFAFLQLNQQLMPMLETLYNASKRTSNQIYMVLIILLILSQDSSFNASIHKLVSTAYLARHWTAFSAVCKDHINILFLWTDIAQCSVVPRTSPPSNISWLLDGHNSY